MSSTQILFVTFIIIQNFLNSVFGSALVSISAIISLFGQYFTVKRPQALDEFSNIRRVTS